MISRACDVCNFFCLFFFFFRNRHDTKHNYIIYSPAAHNYLAAKRGESEERGTRCPRRKKKRKKREISTVSKQASKQATPIEIEIEIEIEKKRGKIESHASAPPRSAPPPAAPG